MINAADIVRAGVSGLSVLYETGASTPTQVAKVYFDRIGIYNKALNCYLHFNENLVEEAKAATKRWQAGLQLSPMDGVPMAVKSNIAVKGLPWDGGFAAYRNRLAEKDAEVVKRLRQAGAVIIGTLNMEEGALGARTDNPWFGPTWNPHREGYTPGGSSGGSGAAVAAGLCAAALGSDTMGSVRIPSAYCGVYGLKTARDAVPGEGLVPLSPTLDTVGPHARSIEDIRLIYEVLAGNSIPAVAPPSVAVLDWGDAVEVTDEVQKGFRAALETLSKVEIETSHTSLENYEYGETRINGLILSEVEGYAAHRQAMATDPDGFSPMITTLFNYGASLETDRVQAAYDHIAAMAATPGDWGGSDVLIMPTAPQTAFPMAELPPNQADFTAYANVTGLPALSIPAGKTKDGLPLAFQAVGRAGQEAQLFALAEVYGATAQQDMRPEGYGY